MKKINNLISTFRLENSLKNILIFFPLVFSNKEFLLNDILKLTFGVLIFTIMTSICYVTNDYTDRFKDKINKLKSLKKVSNKSANPPISPISGIPAAPPRPASPN